MPKIFPFRAVRPSLDKVSLVTTRAYEDYSPTELAAHLDFNAFSFLHIINPAFVNQQKIDAMQRFRQVGAKYKDFKNEEIFIQDEEPAFYLYKIQQKKNQFIGFLAGTSIEDYQKNNILKHEDTLEYRVQMLKEYFKQSEFNTEPVLLMHPKNEALEEWVDLYQKNQPTYDFSTSNKERHTLWKIERKENIKTIQDIFSNFKQLYIADGHHRTEASNMLFEDMEYQSAYKNFMSYIICESNVRISEFNRVIHDLNGWSNKEFIQQLKQDFHIEKTENELWKPKEKCTFGMYLDGVYYKLKLKVEDNKTLDAEILYQKILHSLLEIKDLRTDSRIQYISGNQNLSTLFQLIDNSEYKVGFTLLPPTIDDIKYYAEHALTMPPKSTYIEPKLRNGLIIYEYNSKE